MEFKLCNNEQERHCGATPEGGNQTSLRSQALFQHAACVRMTEKKRRKPWNKAAIVTVPFSKIWRRAHRQFTEPRLQLCTFVTAAKSHREPRRMQSQRPRQSLKWLQQSAAQWQKASASRAALQHLLLKVNKHWLEASWMTMSKLN